MRNIIHLFDSHQTRVAVVDYDAKDLSFSLKVHPIAEDGTIEAPLDEIPNEKRLAEIVAVIILRLQAA